MKINPIDLKDLYPAMIARDSIMTNTLEQLRQLGLLEETIKNINRKGSPDNARNQAVEAFLESGKRTLLWIDSDVVLPYNISQLIEDPRPVRSAVCSAYLNGWKVPLIFKKEGRGLRPFSLEEMREEAGKTTEQLKKGLLPDGIRDFYATGLGCCCIDREVFEKTRDIDGVWHRQCWNDEEGVRYGEDIYFYTLLHKHNIASTVRLDINAGHMKLVML